jgi:uncharacterized membrane protein YeaQ/YmgE (transglycosylase-associated protein family)
VDRLDDELAGPLTGARGTAGREPAGRRPATDNTENRPVSEVCRRSHPGIDDLALDGPAPTACAVTLRRSAVLGNIIVLIIVGLIAGFIARAVIPGKQDLGIVATILLGIVGSLVGNLLGSLIFEPHRFELGTSGILGSIVGAIIVLGLYVAATRRKHVTR